MVVFISRVCVVISLLVTVKLEMNLKYLVYYDAIYCD